MSTDLVETNNAGSGSMVEVATGRVIQEVQAAMTIAKRFPRNETASVERINTACRRKGLASRSMYSYPKGKKKVTGPSIRLAEVLAQCWGNVDFGLIELEQRSGESDVMSYCWDLETNTRATKIFTVKHEVHLKDGGIKHLSDPRDIYEHTANYGARRMRACILATIPRDIQDLAVAACNKTLAGDDAGPLIDRIRKMVSAFGDIGVPQDAIERRLQHKVEACNEPDLVDLRGIYQSLSDDMSKREDWFDMETTEAVASHREQARATRETAADASQVNPAVDAADGVDDPPEPDPAAPLVVEAEQAKTITDATKICDVDENEALALAHQADPEARARLTRVAANQRIVIKSKRAGKNKADPSG